MLGLITGSSSGLIPTYAEKRKVSRPTIHARGLIPAHARKTRPTPKGPTLNRAHPQSHGENLGFNQQSPLI